MMMAICRNACDVSNLRRRQQQSSKMTMAISRNACGVQSQKTNPNGCNKALQQNRGPYSPTQDDDDDDDDDNNDMPLPDHPSQPSPVLQSLFIRVL